MGKGQCFAPMTTGRRIAIRRPVGSSTTDEKRARMEDTEYDYDGYQKSLERTLTLAEKDYWTQYIDVNRHQVNVAKTYLWVAVALMGSYTAVFSKYQSLFTTECMTPILAFISAISAIAAFGICLYAIPARKGYHAVSETSWGYFTDKANKMLECDKKRIYIAILTTLCDHVDKANYHNVATNQNRAKLLRRTSWILIISFTFAILTSLSLLANSLPVRKVNMTDPTQNKPTQPSQSPKPAPDVPKPAGPLSGGNPNISTHSIPNSSTDSIEISQKIRLTEGIDPKKN